MKEGEISVAESVQGQRYKSMVDGIGAPSYVQKNIFIPDYQLNFCQDGKVHKMERPLITLAASKALDAVVSKINSREYREQKGDLAISSMDNDLLIKQAMEKANETALTPVQISKDLVEQIKELYEKSVDDNTRLGQVRPLEGRIKQLIQESRIFDN